MEAERRPLIPPPSFSTTKEKNVLLLSFSFPSSLPLPVRRCVGRLLPRGHGTLSLFSVFQWTGSDKDELSLLLFPLLGIVSSILPVTVVAARPVLLLSFFFSLIQGGSQREGPPLPLLEMKASTLQTELGGLSPPFSSVKEGSIRDSFFSLFLRVMVFPASGLDGSRAVFLPSFFFPNKQWVEQSRLSFLFLPLLSYGGTVLRALLSNFLCACFLLFSRR